MGDSPKKATAIWALLQVLSTTKTTACGLPTGRGKEMPPCCHSKGTLVQRKSDMNFLTFIPSYKTIR